MIRVEQACRRSSGGRMLVTASGGGPSPGRSRVPEQHEPARVALDVPSSVKVADFVEDRRDAEVGERG
jgi:hypothetical protein